MTLIADRGCEVQTVAVLVLLQAITEIALSTNDSDVDWVVSDA